MTDVHRSRWLCQSIIFTPLKDSRQKSHCKAMYFSRPNNTRATFNLTAGRNKTSKHLTRRCDAMCKPGPLLFVPSRLPAANNARSRRLFAPHTGYNSIHDLNYISPITDTAFVGWGSFGSRPMPTPSLHLHTDANYYITITLTVFFRVGFGGGKEWPALRFLCGGKKD